MRKKYLFVKEREYLVTDDLSISEIPDGFIKVLESSVGSVISDKIKELESGYVEGV